MKNQTSKKGFLLHAFQSNQIDYIKLAVCCALSIKTNLKHNNVTLLTDKNYNAYLRKSIPEEIINKAFDRIILSKEKFLTSKRTHHDSPWTTFKADFNNKNRSLSYYYTQYDETILLDTDYIVMNDSFDYIWENNDDILINKKVIDLKIFNEILAPALPNWVLLNIWTICA